MHILRTEQRTQQSVDLRGFTLVIIAGAFLVGIFISSLLPLPSLALLIGIVPALGGVILLWRGERERIIMLCITCLLIGAWRYAYSSPVNDTQALSNFIGAGKVEVRGNVSDEPTIQGRSRVLLITASSISLDGGNTWQDAHGTLEARTLETTIESPYGANYGDDVELQGALQPPTQYSGAGVFATMAFPRISVTGSGGNPLIAALYHLRVLFAAVIAQSLPQPEASVLIAILLSLRTPALKPLTAFFNETGTAHLIAPSGFKVTIVAGLMMSSTRWLYEKRNSPERRLLPAERRRGNVRRWLATALVIASIVVYTIISGASPAALRAGIMGIIVVIAPRVGRVYNVYTSLACAALVMNLFDPFLLWDVGFQLSFTGTLGIVLLTPPIQRLLTSLERLPGGHTLGEISASSVAAVVATLPIMAINFNQVSIIAPVTNILTVPLLELLLIVGLLLCCLGLLFAPLGVLCGYALWPLLWYIINAIQWNASIPHAYFPVPPFTPAIAWGYYGLLALLYCTIRYKWPTFLETGAPTVLHTPLPSKRAWRSAQIAAALLVVMATVITANISHASGQLAVTFLNVCPASQPSQDVCPPGQPSQGEAILITTPDGKTALIDGGLDATSLGQELDSRLPPWQRSLDLVLLTSPRTDHLTASQDIVSRYQIGVVMDAGMLHPNTGYALWRRTIEQRGIHYLQARQGASFALGTSVVLQVFWPSAQLHKSSDEERDNGLIVRLVAPGLHLLLLGVTAASKYALSGLLSTIAPAYLQANAVQIVAQAGKAFAPELAQVLQAAHPSYLILTPGSLTPKQRKAGTSTILTDVSQFSTQATQVEQTAQRGTLTLTDNNNGLSITPT